MKKEIADKWVTALRSGEYEQGIGKLNKDGKFCCLGVLCELAVKDDVVLPITDSWDLTTYDGEAAWLPNSVVNWSGMKDDNGMFGDDSLVHMNDSGKSFEEIAEVIEKNYQDL